MRSCQLIIFVRRQEVYARRRSTTAPGTKCDRCLSERAVVSCAIISKPVSQTGIYRNALQVSSSLVASLDDVLLNELMGHLLPAQGYRCGCRDAYANAEVDARDKGCDGWNAPPAKPDRWLGETATCWQFKAGRKGEPAQIADEVVKPIPYRTLQQGGRFVLVASGSTSGRSGVEERRERLVEGAHRAGLPTDNIEVYGSEQLAVWCNQHPAVAARLTAAPAGLWTVDRWERSEEHRLPYQASPRIASDLALARSQVDFEDSDSGNVLHLHVQGQPGVGKTRFALEACRAAPWRESAIYVRQAEEVRLAELIDSAAESPDVRLVVVADEVQPGRLEPLRDSVGLAGGRLRLITIGPGHTPDPSRISQIPIEPLEPAAMRAAVSDWYPDMPWEHVDFVTEFAAGYMKLGRLTADAVAKEPSATLPDLLARREIRGILDSLFGGGSRRALYVVAVLTHVGWTDDKRHEGRIIAEHLGLDWNDVRDQVDDLHRSMGIVPRGGRYRYISPEPLAIYLAHDAWETYPDLMKSLPESLPSESAKEAYYNRLASIASSPHAKEFSRDQLRNFFFRIDDFVDVHTARRWSALSNSDPELAAHALCKALAASSVEVRRNITFQALAVLVWRLARIASRSTGFHDATTALALLAEPENETWGNGASREFFAKYHVSLGATALPYLQRLVVLDELLELRSTRMAQLVVGALGQVGNHSAGGVVMPSSDQAPEPDWEPPSQAELLQCITTGVDRLRSIASQRDPALQADLFTAATKVSWLLRFRDAGSKVATLFSELRTAYTDLREPLRKQIATVLRRDKEHMAPEQRTNLDELHARFEDSSLDGRVQQYVGPHRWERETAPDLAALAADLIMAPGVLAKQWSWLTGGAAGAAWELGEALAAADTDGRLSAELTRFLGGGPDQRLVCGYVAARRRVLGDEWYERWTIVQFEREPQPIALLFEVLSRCGATDKLTCMTAQLLRSRQVERTIVGRLKYADWTDTSDSALELLLQAMTETGHRETVVSLLQRRLGSPTSDLSRWQSLAMELVLDLSLIRCREMPNHYWYKLATILVPDHPRAISAAIFQAHAKRDRSDPWMIRYEKEVVKVLHSCVDHAPGEVWEELRPHLWPLSEAMLFVIGFPTTVLEHLPPQFVMEWIAESQGEQAVQRAALLASLTNKKSLNDETIAAHIIAQYGSDETVSDAFLSHHISGTFAGPGSHHFRELANNFSGIAKRTALPGVRSWANRSESVLRRMANQEQREEEEHALLLR